MVIESIVGGICEHDVGWMRVKMLDNYCMVGISQIDDVISMLERVSTTLNIEEWFVIKQLICEVILNAQIHGRASICKLHIEKDKIIITDDGADFNPIDLVDKTTVGGGGITIRKVVKMYPEVELKYFCGKHSQEHEFVIDFANSVFDVNSLCEIVVKTLIGLRVAAELTEVPEGIFRYYFIDMKKTFDDRPFYTVSDVHGLLNSLYKVLQDNKETEKVFIYFSRDQMCKNAYHDFKEVIAGVKLSDKIECILDDSMNQEQLFI